MMSETQYRRMMHILRMASSKFPNENIQQALDIVEGNTILLEDDGFDDPPKRLICNAQYRNIISGLKEFSKSLPDKPKAIIESLIDFFICTTNDIEVYIGKEQEYVKLAKQVTG